MSLLVTREASLNSISLVLDEWNRRKLRWMLLRAVEEHPNSQGDIDILFHPADAAAGRAVLALAGFSELKSYGRGTHRFFLNYSNEEQTWTQLDIVTELAFGPHAELFVAKASALVESRQSDDGRLFEPDESDTFWSVLFHCMLDKNFFSTKYDALFDHFNTPPLKGKVWNCVSELLPIDLVEELTLRYEKRDFDGVAALGPEVREQIIARDSVRARQREVKGKALRVFERPLQFGRRRGLTVALLGPDGSGKSSLSAAVSGNYFFRSEEVYFGLWKNPASGLLGKVAKVLLRPTVAIRTWVQGQLASCRGRLVIFDRYTYDALLAPTGAFKGLKKTYMSVLSRACPQPDLVVMLDAPGSVMFERKGEKSIQKLEAERQGFADIRERIRKPVLVIDATKSVNEVANETIDFIWKFQKKRLDNQKVSS